MHLAELITTGRAAEDEKWKHLSLSTDFEDAPSAEEQLRHLNLEKSKQP